MRKLVVLVLSLALVLGCAFSVRAEGNVTYSSDAGEFIFAKGSEYSETDLFTDFKDVMPGDTISQLITIKNNASNKVKVKIYLRSLGADAESEEFLSGLKLSVAKNDSTEMFSAAASEPAELVNWVELGTLYSGGETDILVKLTVPTELDNAYAEKIGIIDWEFKVEEYPIEPSDPTAPPTGDSSNLAAWIGVFAVAAALLAVLLIKKRKAHN